jgi:predicted O-methyltransferase YrrM
MDKSGQRSSVNMGYLNLLFKKQFYTEVIPHPVSLFTNIFYTLYYTRRNPNWPEVDKKVEGYLTLPVAALLHRGVLASKKHPSTNVIEVGAFKGKSTIYLSSAAKQTGKRVKSFDLFTGLPTADPVLDPEFKKGQLKSDVDVYKSNIQAYGYPDVVDTTVGDARQTLLPTLGDGGFCLAFLDVDLYEVTKELLGQLFSVAQGGETIFIHDAYSPGIRKATDESVRASRHSIKRTEPIYHNTIKLKILRANGQPK